MDFNFLKMANRKEVIFLKPKKSYGDYRHSTSNAMREIYKNEENQTILEIANDRLPVFGRALEINIPDKGRLLTAISANMSVLAEKKWDVWTDYLCSNAPSQARINPWGEIVDYVPEHESIFEPELAGRVTIREEIKMFPFDCIVYGRLMGDIWRAYQQGHRKFDRVILPGGLEYGVELPKPVFLATTKTPAKHCGRPIFLEEMTLAVGSKGLAMDIHWQCCKFFEEAYAFFLERGIILADTKFKIGGGSDYRYIIFGGEVMTPDCSHFWDAKTFVPGQPADSYDEQFIIDYFTANPQIGLDETPQIPEELIQQTRQKYVDLYELITGRYWIE